MNINSRNTAAGAHQHYAQVHGAIDHPSNIVWRGMRHSYCMDTGKTAKKNEITQTRSGLRPLLTDSQRLLGKLKNIEDVQS